jgi:hypothetical protein
MRAFKSQQDLSISDLSPPIPKVSVSIRAKDKLSKTSIELDCEGGTIRQAGDGPHQFFHVLPPDSSQVGAQHKLCGTSDAQIQM